MITDNDKQSFRQTYEDWLRSGGAIFQSVTNQNVFSETIYTHANKMTVNIIQMRDTSDRIILTARLNLDSNTQQALFSLPEEMQFAFANEITLLLIHLGIQFNFILQEQKLLAIVIERTLFGEGLTKQVFFDNLYKIIDATVGIQTKFRERLGGMSVKGSATGAGTSFYG